jgi:hypothetical protein
MEFPEKLDAQKSLKQFRWGNQNIVNANWGGNEESWEIADDLVVNWGKLGTHIRKPVGSRLR